MSPAIHFLSPSNGPSTAALPISATTDEAFFHVGAQFYGRIETPKTAVVVTASSSTAHTRKPKVTSSHSTLLEQYLQTANRTEYLCLGMQSSRSSRVFDNRLIFTMDTLLLQIGANATHKAISPDS